MNTTKRSLGYHVVKNSLRNMKTHFARNLEGLLQKADRNLSRKWKVTFRSAKLILANIYVFLKSLPESPVKIF